MSLRGGGAAAHTELRRLSGATKSTIYIRNSVVSRNSAIHKVYHTSPCPSSLPEPRHPSLNVWVGSITTCVSPMWIGLQTSIRHHMAWRKKEGRTAQHITATFSIPNECAAICHAHSQRMQPSMFHHATIILLHANDPSAGSPTETLLRLLLPLSDKVH